MLVAVPAPVMDERLGYLLKRAQARLAEATAVALKPWRLDGRQWAILEVVALHAPIAQGDAARLIGVDRSTMVSLLDALEEKGLVARRPKPGDRRANIVELPRSARKTLASIRAAGAEAQRAFLARLDASSVDELFAALRALTRDDTDEEARSAVEPH
jgi:DNA-binding MarR family transcriptional regulator